jgi:hypothetical protein
MKATNRFSIHFKLRAERMKDGFAPVFLGLVVDGKRSYMALKNFQAETEHWDKIKGGGRKEEIHHKKTYHQRYLYRR